MSIKKSKLNFSGLQINISNLADASVIKNFKPNPVKRNPKLDISPELENLFRLTDMHWLQSLNRLNPVALNY